MWEILYYQKPYFTKGELAAQRVELNGDCVTREGHNHKSNHMLAAP